MKTISLIIHFIFIHFAFAAEIEIITGHSNGSCSSSDQSLLYQSRSQAETKAGAQKVRVSDWSERAFTQGWHYMPESCRNKGAWSEALFVNTNQKNEPLFLTLTGGSYNPRRDHNIPGSGKLSKEQAWELAFTESKERALQFCKEIAESQILNMMEKLFNNSSWYDYYTVEVRFHCIL